MVKDRGKARDDMPRKDSHRDEARMIKDGPGNDGARDVGAARRYRDGSGRRSHRRRRLRLVEVSPPSLKERITGESAPAIRESGRRSQRSDWRHTVHLGWIKVT